MDIQKGISLFIALLGGLIPYFLYITIMRFINRKKDRRPIDLLKS